MKYKPNERLRQCLVANLSLYMLQISLVSADLTSFDRQKFLSMFSSKVSSLWAADLTRLFSSFFLCLNSPLSLHIFKTLYLPLLILPAFS